MATGPADLLSKATALCLNLRVCPLSIFLFHISDCQCFTWTPALYEKGLSVLAAQPPAICIIYSGVHGGP